MNKFVTAKCWDGAFRKARYLTLDDDNYPDNCDAICMVNGKEVYGKMVHHYSPDTYTFYKVD